MFVSAADNNVYVKEEWDSLPSAVSRVTGDGVEGEVYNGIPDWVYEEEVLGTNVVRFKFNYFWKEKQQTMAARK